MPLNKVPGWFSNPDAVATDTVISPPSVTPSASGNGVTLTLFSSAEAPGCKLFLSAVTSMA
jgi:hypothetical protein